MPEIAPAVEYPPEIDTAHRAIEEQNKFSQPRTSTVVETIA